MERTEEKILSNTGLIHYILQKQLHVPVTHTDYEDLYQQGVIGLILAIDRFDESRGCAFATFATHYIRGVIQQYKRDFSLPIHCPRPVKDAIFKVSKGTSDGLSLEEIEATTGLSHSEIHDALCVLEIGSLQKIVADELSLGDMVPSKGAYEEFLSKENIDFCIKTVADGIKNPNFRSMWLDFVENAREGEIIRQQVLGDKHGMTQAHVSRTLKKYNEQLKELLEQG